MSDLKLYWRVYFIFAILLIPIIFYWGWMLMGRLRHPSTTLRVSTKPEKFFSQIKPIWPKKIPILMYHYIEYVTDKRDTIRQSLNITPYILEHQIQTLLNAGYTFITARELGEIFDGKLDIPKKPILLTFDDGYRDFYTDAYPIIKKYRVKATAYIISGFIGYRNYMAETQIKTIAQEGLVEIGANTVHHLSFSHAPIHEIQKELRESKTTLETLIGKSVVSFAYPNGSYDEYAMNEVEQSGFTIAMGTRPGITINPQDRFTLSRIRPWSNIGADLLIRISK